MGKAPHNEELSVKLCNSEDFCTLLQTSCLLSLPLLSLVFSERINAIMTLIEKDEYILQKKLILFHQDRTKCCTSS